MNKPDLILCSDLHLRLDQPICRTDNFPEAQWNKMEQLCEIQEKYNCPVLCSGDVFHHWKPSPNLIRLTIKHLPKKFYTIYGQHDLYDHNFKLRHLTGIAALEEAEVLTVLPATHWKQKPKTSFEIKGKKICVIHKFVWDGEKLPWPECNESTAQQLLKKYKKFDLIVTGDHHKSFIYNTEKRMLINPGCFTRQTADYKNHEPCIYLWFAKINLVQLVYLKINKDVISREHIDIKRSKDEKIKKYVSTLDEWKLNLGLPFEKQMRNYLRKNPVIKPIKRIILKSFNYEKDAK